MSATEQTPKYKLVPVDLTKEMRAAYHRANDYIEEGDDAANRIGSPDFQWQQMLAAAPAVNAHAETQARVEALRRLLSDAKQQIEYLHDKFGETGSGAAILSRIDAALSPQPTKAE